MYSVNHDFSLIFEREPKEKAFTVHVACSMAGRGKGRFQIPDLGKRNGGLSHRQAAEVEGQALFDALFHGKIRDLYLGSLERLDGIRISKPHEKRDRHLQVRIGIDPEDKEVRDLLNKVDWELLCDRSKFLCRSRQTTVVRDLGYAAAFRPLLDQPPIRILLAFPEPSGDYERLDLAEEERAIRRAWKRQPDTAADTLEALEHQLFSEGPFHILHFGGHGAVCEARGEGLLVFERDDGSPHEVMAKQLMETLDGHPDLRLVILNACESGRGPEEFPSRGVGVSLMRNELPAVVASRRTLGDGPAVSFAQAFHRQLARGLEVDVAMTAARRAIDDSDEAFREWATPVLFLGGDGGRLFQFEASPLSPLDLGIRSRMHPFAPLEKTTHYLLDLVPFFYGRAIREEGFWREKVEPHVERFLRQYLSIDRPITLRLDAHLSVAFAVGRCVDTRGIDLTLKQGGPGGFADWKPSSPWTGPLWKQEERRTASAGQEFAIAVGVTDDVRKKVDACLPRHASGVGRVVYLAPAEGWGQQSIEGADHAWALAEEIRRLVHARGPEEEASPLHLFFAGPGALAFYVGQLSRGFGVVQLYEFAYEDREVKEYSPSLRIEPEQGGRR